MSQITMTQGAPARHPAGVPQSHSRFTARGLTIGNCRARCRQKQQRCECGTMECDRRSFRLGGRAWRVMTWPLSGHVALALATGLACGIAASHYPDLIAPSSAAIIGTLALYLVMVAAWWRLNSLGGAGDDRLAEADRGNCQRRDSRRMNAD